MNWANDKIFTNPIRFCLATNEKEYRWALKSANISGAEPFGTWGGRANAEVRWYGPGNEGDMKTTTTAIVCVDLKSLAKNSGTEVAGILVHEAVHIWQRICIVLGEKRPSDEFEAYSIQTIAQNLMCQYRDRAHDSRRT